MDRSVAQGGPPEPRSGPLPDRWTALWPIAVGILLALVALAVYSATRADRYYDHFVWQAAAFLEGHAAIRYPVEATIGVSGNWYFQDVLPIATNDGVPRGLLPFPPLPALLMPFVALWGLATDDQAIFTILAAVDVAICWWALGRLSIRPIIRFGATTFLAFGTVFWYTAQVATTWYQAHIVAVGRAAAVGLAVDGDPADPASPVDRRRRGASPTGSRGAGRMGLAGEIGRGLAVDRRQFLAGLLFGLACTARLTVVFAAPFFPLIGAGGGWRRRGWSAALGAAVPLVLLVAYNVASTGHIVQPAYDYPRTSGFQRLPDPRLPQRVVHRGPALSPAEHRDHAVHAAGHLARAPAGRPGCLEHAGLRGAGRATRLVRPELSARGPVGPRHELLFASPAYLLASRRSDATVEASPLVTGARWRSCSSRWST